MIDPNTKTDYNKMKRLLQLDKLDGNRKGIIRRITEEGSIVSNLYETFPASEIVKPEYFPSLLFYYGMLTIKDTFGDQLLLGIPNNNVRRQYYGYLQEQYQEINHINLNEFGYMLTCMAFMEMGRCLGLYVKGLRRSGISKRWHRSRAQPARFLHGISLPEQLLHYGSRT